MDVTKPWASLNPIGRAIRETPLYKRNATATIRGPMSQPCADFDLDYLLTFWTLWHAGVFDLVLRFSGFRRWCLLASAMEHRWLPYPDGSFRVHCLVDVFTPLWRGSHVTSYRIIFLHVLLLVYILFWGQGFVMQRKRVGLLMAAALFQGASIGPLVEIVIDFDPR